MSSTTNPAGTPQFPDDRKVEGRLRESADGLRQRAMRESMKGLIDDGHLVKKATPQEVEDHERD